MDRNNSIIYSSYIKRCQPCKYMINNRAVVPRAAASCEVIRGKTRSEKYGEEVPQQSKDPKGFSMHLFLWCTRNNVRAKLGTLKRFVNQL